MDSRSVKVVAIFVLLSLAVFIGPSQARAQGYYWECPYRCTWHTFTKFPLNDTVSSSIYEVHRVFTSSFDIPAGTELTAKLGIRDVSTGCDGYGCGYQYGLLLLHGNGWVAKEHYKYDNNPNITLRWTVPSTQQVHIVVYIPNKDGYVWNLNVTKKDPNTAPNAAMSLSDSYLRLGVDLDGCSITFDGSPSHDAQTTNDSELRFHWLFTGPDGESFTETGIRPKVSFNDSLLRWGEEWTVLLTVTDPDGASDTADQNFKVVGSPPEITLYGTPSVDVLEPIMLEVRPTVDIDGTCPDSDDPSLKVVWDVVQSPSGTQYEFPTDDYYEISIDTTSDDIGTWKFEAIATDNEDKSGNAEITVEVLNLPPEINLVHPALVIRVGEPIRAETTIYEDVDGGDLNFRWDIIQAPVFSSLDVQEAVLFAGGTGEAGARIEIPTTEYDAGTWILRLVATDDEGESVQEEFAVVVDGPPKAKIVCTTCIVPNSVEQGTIGTLSFPLVLDGNASADPDSPPPPPCPGSESNKCHETLDGRAVAGISPGLSRYLWSLVDVSPELYADYPLGRADEVFGTTAYESTLTLGLTDLEPGDWTFRLEVFDAEGNEDFTTFMVSVIDENGPPIASLSPPERYNTDISGNLDQDVTVSGKLSFDPDNILPGSPPLPGITNYEWDIKNGPNSCTDIPTLQSGPDQRTVDLFTDSVPTLCQGFWRIGLTVTDDDIPEKTGESETSILIGNCPEQLCIDYPTTFNPHIEQFVTSMDIPIFYHLNSALYETPVFTSGFFVKLNIFFEDDPITPVYTSIEPNILATDLGGHLLFHWNGYSNSFERPQSGLYTVQISLLDAEFGATTFATNEPNSIYLAVTKPRILPTSDKYVNFAKLNAGLDTLTLGYKVVGGETSDELLWRIYDASENVVAESVASSVLAGTVHWNGQMADGSIIPPGEYTAELEAFTEGSSLGVSDPHSFVVYKLQITPVTEVEEGRSHKLFVFANTDDDNQNNISDLSETFDEEDDIIKLVITFEPDIPATITLSSDDSSPPFRLWETAAKEAEIGLPVAYDNLSSKELFIEGQNAAISSLSVEARITDGIDLDPYRLDVVIPEISLKDASGSEIYYANIARWDNAYDGSSGLLNAPDPDNFIYDDPSRFYISVNDPSIETGDHIVAQIGTEFDDDMTDISLIETGQDSGEFVSLSQLLTSRDIQDMHDPEADDNKRTWDGNLLIDDDQPGDRTHRADIDGQLVLRYTPQGSPESKLWKWPVCRRAPDERRRVQLRVHIFLEPYRDIGYDHDADPTTPPIGEGDGVFSFVDLNGSGHDLGEPSEPFNDQNGNGIRDAFEVYQDVGYDHDANPDTPLIGVSDGVFSYTDLNGNGHDIGEPSEDYRNLSHGQGAAWRSGLSSDVTDGWGPLITTDRVQDDIVRANIAWAPACIMFELLDYLPIIESAPEFEGVNILADGIVQDKPPDQTTSSDLKIIFDKYEPMMRKDTVEVFYAYDLFRMSGLTLNPLANANGLYPEIGHGEKSFIVIEPTPIYKRTLAHELGHVLTNAADTRESQQFFFPQDTDRPGMFADDRTATNYRRISQDTINMAREDRQLDETDYHKRGNHVLKPW